MMLKLNNILFLDIETVAQSENYSKLDEQTQKLWDKKSANIRNLEELSSEELYETKAGIFAEFGKIITIGIGFFNKEKEEKLTLRVKALADDDEEKLLLEFKELVNTKFNPKTLVLCAHNGKEFDFPYISRRMLINGISLPVPFNTAGKKPWEVAHLDTMELWKFGDRKNYTSLDLLANIFGIESSKDDIDGSMVNEVYYATGNLERIAKYCKQDVVVAAQLYLKLNALPIVEEENIILM